MINYLNATSATLTSGSNKVQVVGNVDFSIVNDSYLCAVSNGQYVIPVASGTAPDANGDSTLTLAENWDGITLNNVKLFTYPTFQNIEKTVSGMNALSAVTRGILTRFNDLLTSNSETIDIRVGATEKITTTPYQYIVEKSKLLAQEIADELGVLITQNDENKKNIDDWKVQFQGNSILPCPLNYNAFLQDLGQGPLEHWGTRGSVVIEAVHPYTKGFEGPYVSYEPENRAATLDEATQDKPYWWGRYNKGPRARRGGLAGGWGGISNGNILKIYKPAGEYHSYANSCMFSMIELYKRTRSRFRAYIYVAKGPLNFDFGLTDDGGQINIPSTNEWHFIDVIVGQSEVISSYMNINIDHSEECEIYIAMLNIFAVEGAGNDATMISRRTR